MEDKELKFKENLIQDEKELETVIAGAENKTPRFAIPSNIPR